MNNIPHIVDTGASVMKMSANELYEGVNSPHNACCYRDKCRQQQTEIEELEKENTELRYLIAIRQEKQDGISLNSMAHQLHPTKTKKTSPIYIPV